MKHWGGCGLSQVVRGCRGLAQRACGGSQGRLRAARANPRHPCGQPCSIPAAGGVGALGGLRNYVELDNA